MTLEWNEAKNRSKVSKHGLNFSEAEEMFRGPLFTRQDIRQEYGEVRWLGLGRVGGRLAAVLFTHRDPDIVRIISLRKANRREQKQYEASFQDGLETR